MMEGFNLVTWIIVFIPMPAIMLLVTLEYFCFKFKRKSKHG